MLKKLLTKKVKVKKLHPNAVIPRIMTDGSAGADLTAVSHTHKEGQYDEYGTGLAIKIPEGHVGLLFPRSSISNKDQTLANSVGVLDVDYRGEVKFRFKRKETRNINDVKIYQPGERIGQLVIIPIPTVQFEEVEELDETERGKKGFGGTGA